ncbi:ferredoxin [uncultured Thermanaerothrix sp.]|uniref:ferredoxin n=1 Tax=uncultured Thermanaerothrix sp. TaxID=1195149 RepID=UPI002635D745|nr:ferredoxin [uncultured Thermanaerothrix sp.]
MKVTMDEQRCIRCGFCETIAPEVFSLDGSMVARVKMELIPWHLRDLIYQAAEECPENAIRVID